MNNFFTLKYPNGVFLSDLQKNPSLGIVGFSEDAKVLGVSNIEDAKPNLILYIQDYNEISKNKYQKYLNTLPQNSIIVISQTNFDIIKSNIQNINEINIVIASNPRLTFHKIIDFLYVKKVELKETTISNTANIASNTIIGSNVEIQDNVTIGNFCTIEDGVQIKSGTIIGNNTNISYNSIIGQNCNIGNNVNIECSVIGDGCEIHHSSVLGKVGFGFEIDKSTNKFFYFKHIGCLNIGNNVSIGSNTCIDRGVIIETKIDDNVKIDNLCQIGHNVKIGKYTVMAGVCGIAGSVTIGDRCMIGGDVKITGHVSIGNDVGVSGGSFIVKNIQSGTKIKGCIHAMDWLKWNKFMASLSILSKNFLNKK